MPDQMIVQYCSPTLAGLKTGNMFSVKFSSHEEMILEIRILNQEFKDKGLRAIPLGKKNGRYLIYVYRPAFLKEDLTNPEAKAILLEKGYRTASTEGCLAQLALRTSRGEDFPHEVGLFLGYPPSDVKAFMEHPEEGVAASGSWKAYSNADHARKTFAMYRRCTETYCREVRKGRPLSLLTVRTDVRRKIG